MATCPECDADLPVGEDELEEGDPVECDECGSSFVVTGTDPLELELDDDEDDEDDDEDEDDLEDEDGLEDEDEEEEEGDWEE
jgi:alpha-aminoadipate carrier protein LysW